MKHICFWTVAVLILSTMASLISCSDDDDDSDDDSGDSTADDSDDDTDDNGLYDRCMAFYIDCMGYSEDDSVGYCAILPGVTDPCQIEAHNQYLDCMETNIDCEDFSVDESLACSEALEDALNAC